MSAANSLDRCRAAHALAAVRALQQQDNGHYVSYVRGLPATILQAGLGQALGTLGANASLDKSREKLGVDERAKRNLYEQVSAWLVGDHDNAPYRGHTNVWTALTQGTESDYIHAQAEALAYLTWLKKFAVAFLKDPGIGGAA